MKTSKPQRNGSSRLLQPQDTMHKFYWHEQFNTRVTTTIWRTNNTRSKISRHCKPVAQRLQYVTRYKIEIVTHLFKYVEIRRNQSRLFTLQHKGGIWKWSGNPFLHWISQTFPLICLCYHLHGFEPQNAPQNTTLSIAEYTSSCRHSMGSTQNHHPTRNSAFKSRKLTTK